jgi:hypothetical protein
MRIEYEFKGAAALGTGAIQKVGGGGERGIVTLE